MNNKKIDLLKSPLSYWRGMIHYKRKEWSLAEPFFQKAVEIKPYHAYSNFKLGMCFFKQKSWDLAYKYISIAVSLAPENTQWLVQLRQSEIRIRIKSKLKNNNLDNIISNNIKSSTALDVEELLILEQIEKDPTNNHLFYSLANIQYKQNKLWQAAESLKNSLEIQEDEKAFYLLGIISEKLLRYQEASDAYSNCIRLRTPKNSDADLFYRLGFVNEFQGLDNIINLALAKESYNQAILKDTKLNAKVFGIGVFHYARRYWDKAAMAFQIEIKNNADKAELFYKLGFCFDRNYQWEQAEKYYLLALKNNKKPEWQFRLGFVQEKQEKYEEALENYRSSAELRKKYTPYWYYRAAYCAEKLGLFKEAANLYLKLRKEKNINIASFLQKNSILNNLNKLLNTRISQDATQSSLWYELGQNQEQLGKFEEAEYAYSQAIARENTLNSLWYYRLGFVLTKQEKYEQACCILRNYRIMQRAHGVSEDILFKDNGYAEAATFSEYYAELPVRANTILYESFSGQGLSCNPYALFLYLFQHSEYKNWTHIWVVNDPSKIPEKYKKYRNVIFIARGSDAYLRYLTTTSVLINNSNFPPYFVRKPEQKFLSTWHGTPFKTLGRDMEGRFFEHKNLTRNIFQATHVLSPNPHTSKILYERHDIKDIYTGKLIETGYPRIDMTLNLSKEEKDSMRDALHLKEGEKLVFYAPTWRGTHGDIDFDYKKLQSDINALSNLKGARIVFRGHSLLQNALSEMNLDIQVAPDELDTNKLLAITDILITDYSSVLFDYLPTRRPLILYMYDIKEYKEERGLYFSENELPGKKCYNIKELLKTLSGLLKHEEKYFNEHDINKFAPHDDGNVSERVVKALFNDDYTGLKIINTIPQNKKSLLIYGGPFMGNGITTSVINLISCIDRSRYTITLVIDPGSIEKEEGRLAQFNKLPKDINVIARVGRMDLNLEERYIHSMNNQDYELYSKEAYKVLQTSWDFEYKRVFGAAKFDSLIQFEGYNRFWAGVFASQSTEKKVSIFMHNSMEEEYRLKYPYLKSIFGYSRLVNNVISVSKLTMLLNQEKLSSKFNIPEDKFTYCDNLQQPELIKQKAKEPLLEDKQYFEGNGKVFLTIGRLSVEKDHEKLIRSFSRLLKKYPDSKLLIIGDGPLKLMLTQVIKSLKVENNVHLLGLRFNPFPLLKKADCFILPSNHEGQPMTLLEAMILEKPIIATDIIGSRSVLEGRTGCLVDNSIDGLLKGMTNFIECKFENRTFDINSYQNSAISQFYQNI